MKETAEELYFTMIRNYKQWERQGVDKNACYNRFVNAAKELAEMDVPNPFRIENKTKVVKKPIEILGVVSDEAQTEE